MTKIGFGAKKIYHEYQDDEQPLSYSFQSETGQFYLAKLVDYGPKTHITVCINVPVAKSELTDFENNKLTFKQLYHKIKNRTAIIEQIDDETVTMTTKSVADLPDYYLKKTDTYLAN